jgi:hypothetical protein
MNKPFGLDPQEVYYEECSICGLEFDTELLNDRMCDECYKYYDASDVTTAPHPLDGKLEPECRDMLSASDAYGYSIAISLKRIADQLDGIGGTDRDKTSIADVLNALPYFLNKWGGPSQ